MLTREKLSALLSRFMGCMVICQHLTSDCAASRDAMTSSNLKLWVEDRSAGDEAINVFAPELYRITGEWDLCGISKLIVLIVLRNCFLTRNRQTGHARLPNRWKMHWFLMWHYAGAYQNSNLFVSPARQTLGILSALTCLAVLYSRISLPIAGWQEHFANRSKKNVVLSAKNFPCHHILPATQPSGYTQLSYPPKNPACEHLRWGSR